MRHPIPPVPPADAEILTPIETAGFLRIRTRRLKSLQREDMTFPKPFLVGEQKRWRSADLVEWFETLKRGFSTRGGWSRRSRTLGHSPNQGEA
jgi:hypothetical protein